MTKRSSKEHLPLYELDLSAAGQGPLVSGGTVTNEGGYQQVGGAAAAGHIFMNDLERYLGSSLLKAEFSVRQAAHTSGEFSYWGLAGARNATGANMNPFIGFRLDGDDEVKVWVNDGTNTFESPTGFSLGSTDWKLCTIDFYTGVMSRSMPSPSVGGLGHVKFAVGNDKNLLRPVAEDIAIDMSAFAASRFQVIWQAEGATDNVLHAQWADIEYRLN